MPGFGEGGGTLRADEIADALVGLLEAFAEGTRGAARPIVDLNFNLEPEGCVRVAKALDELDLLWLEVDLFDPAALAHVRHVAPMPICSGENLYGSRAFRPHLEAAGMDVASVDVVWNGSHRRRRSPTSPRRSRSTARRTTTTRISQGSSRPSGARQSRTRGSSSSTSTTSPGTTARPALRRSLPASSESRQARGGGSS